VKDFAVVADIISEKLFKERPMLSDVNPRSHLYGLAIQDFPAHSQPIYTTLTPKSTTWSPDNKSQVGPVLPV